MNDRCLQYYMDFALAAFPTLTRLSIIDKQRQLISLNITLFCHRNRSICRMNELSRRVQTVEPFVK